MVTAQRVHCESSILFIDAKAISVKLSAALEIENCFTIDFVVRNIVQLQLLYE